MRYYLLDSPIVTGYLKGRKVVTLVEPWVEQNQAATSLLVYGEISEYNHSFPDFARRQTDLRALLQQVYPYGLSYLILERYAELRRMLRPPQGPGLIGDIDTLIAATALVYDLTLVTTDSDFSRVPDLRLMLLPRDMLKA
ncbi:MAG TPA: type II toxin-antitoxin system VapC family toxin [Ktedonobacteraceae bacterium]|nr:type II toxin-antitoxin system VapC family toxin [Ktedonobacteraceae bacterium]